MQIHEWVCGYAEGRQASVWSMAREGTTFLAEYLTSAERFGHLYHLPFAHTPRSG